MYTLQDFLNDPPSPALRVITCPPEVSSIQVESISVQEPPLDDFFIMENEIILSTALGALENEDALRQFIKAVSASRAAALILTFRQPNHQLSSGVVDYAASLGMPLLYLPWQVRFADVVHFVTRKVRDKNLESYKMAQDKLFSAYFTSQPLDTAAHIIHGFLGSPVAIAGSNMAVRGRYPAHFEGEDPTILEIRLNTFLWGYLHIYQPENCAHLISNRALVEKYLSLPLSLWFNRENIENMTVLKLKSDFIWNLANHSYTSFQEMAQQGKKLGFNLFRPYMCIALRIAPKNPELVLDEYSAGAASMAAAMENLIITERRRLGLNLMFAERGLMFALYVEVPSGGAETVLDKLYSALDQRFAQLYPTLQLFGGSSEVSREEAVPFDRLYQNAVLALQFCMNSQSETHVFTYKDTRFHQVISELSGNEAIKTTAYETLNKLLEYEKTSRMDLIRTLTELIKNNYNTSLTARQLHLNRQSLLYRMKKIETLTGLSLSDRRDLFLLEVFTRIYTEY